MAKKTLIKALVSGALLALLMQSTDFGALRRSFSQVSWSIVALVSVGYALGQVLSAYKWALMARASGLHAPFPTALKAYFTGMFANIFGLGMVGGDLTRALLLGAAQKNELQHTKSKAMATVVADRIHGLVVLTVVGALAVLLTAGSYLPLWLVLLLPALAIGLVGGWVLGPAIALKVLPEEHKLRAKVVSITESFPTSPATLWKVSLISALFHSLQIGLHFVMGLGLGVAVAPGLLFSAIPFVSILTSLPISWNGLGVRENAYQYLLAPHALSADQAIVWGAMWLFATTVSSALGGVVGALSHDMPRLKKDKRKRAEQNTDTNSLDTGSSPVTG